jgi:tetratricopeptide (TPR) repeat protein
LKAEHRELQKWCNKRRESFQRAYGEARAVMPKAKDANCLRDRWLNEVLAAMPGVPDFHWLMAMKNKLRNRAEQAILHYRLCCRLKPDFVPYWFFLVSYLRQSKRWDEARMEAEQGLARFPRDPLAEAQVAWVKTLMVINNLAPRRTLVEAKRLFESALDSQGLSGEWCVRIACGLSLCVERLGNSREAEQVLRSAIRTWPSPAADLALELLRRKPAERERYVLERVPELLPELLAA